MSEKNFRFWMPLEKIEKSKDNSGKEVMKLQGFASTTRRDTDGESLDPNNFDISYLKNQGIVNWAHRKDPDSVIGEPLKAEIRKGGLWIESMLYPDSALAKSVYALAQRLQNNSQKRKLGYSIEGRATERDDYDPTKVTKAMITNVALTINPKNTDSLVDIMKGEFNDFIETDTSPEKTSIEEVNTLIKAFSTPEERKSLTEDEIEEEGDLLDKALFAGDTSGTETTNQAIPGSGAPLKIESVNKKLKNTQSVKEEDCEDEDEDEDEDDISKLSKSEVFEKIFDVFAGIGFEKAERIFTSINNLTMKSKKTEITQDVLEKSLKFLKTGLSNDLMNKAMGHEDLDDDDDFEEEDENPSNKKKPVDDDEDEDEDEEVDTKKPFKKFIKSKEIGTDKFDNDEILKSLDNVTSSTIAGFKNVGLILKGIYDQQKTNYCEIQKLSEDLKKSNDNLQETNTSLEDSLEIIKGLEAKIDRFGNTSTGRKSITSVNQIKERTFAQNDDLTKSEGVYGDKTVFSKSRHRQKIINLMDKLTFEKGLDHEMADDMTLFESSGVLNPRAIMRFEKAGFQVIS